MIIISNLCIMCITYSFFLFFFFVPKYDGCIHNDILAKIYCWLLLLYNLAYYILSFNLVSIDSVCCVVPYDIVYFLNAHMFLSFIKTI